MKPDSMFGGLGQLTAGFCLLLTVASVLPAFGQSVREFERGDRTVGEIRRHAQEVVKSFRSAEDSKGFVASVLDLCWLHTEIVVHGDYESNDTLRNLRAQLSSLLQRAAGDIELTIRQIERDGTSSRFQRSAGPGDESRATDGTSRELAQWEGTQSRWLNQVTGGPLATIGQLPGNFAPPFTDRELIELITAVVEPNSWRVNGGNGDIQYYSPALALVVYNSMKVQDEVYDLLLRLR